MHERHMQTFGKSRLQNEKRTGTIEKIYSGMPGTGNPGQPQERVLWGDAMAYKGS